MYRDRNLSNHALYEANFAPEMYCDNYSRALERERIEELDRQARFAANKAMGERWQRTKTQSTPNRKSRRKAENRGTSATNCTNAAPSPGLS